MNNEHCLLTFTSELWHMYTQVVCLLAPFTVSPSPLVSVSPVTDFLKHKFIAAFVAEAKYQAHQDVSSSQCPALVKALKLSREREREKPGPLNGVVILNSVHSRR